MHISTSKFTYVKEKNAFLGDLSDLTSGGEIFHPIYTDALDVGIVLVSHKTGEEATYYLSEEVYSNDEDAEFLYFELRPTLETSRKYPQLDKSLVIIYND